jgi:hypothetical protein
VDPNDRVNIRPHFKTSKLPCSGRVGDLIVQTPLDENDLDPLPQGSASVYVCVRASSVEPRERAVWVRLHVNGFATCETGPLPPPPPNLETLTRG